MDIYLIWAQDGDGYGNYRWLVGAWDDESIGENYKGYEEAVAKAREEHGAENIRVVKARIDFDKVVEAFEPADVGALTNPVAIEAPR